MITETLESPMRYQPIRYPSGVLVVEVMGQYAPEGLSHAEAGW